MLTRRAGPPLGATAVVILAAVHSNGLASPPDKACSLLTAAEITAQVGAPGDGRETEMPAGRGSASNEATKMCTWTIGRGSLRVSFARGTDSDSARQAFRAKVQGTIDAIKATGWTVDQKAFGQNAMCWVATPPANGSAPHTSGCVGATNNLGISVGTTGTTTVEMEKVKKLLDAAMSRVQ